MQKTFQKMFFIVDKVGTFTSLKPKTHVLILQKVHQIRSPFHLQEGILQKMALTWSDNPSDVRPFSIFRWLYLMDLVYGESISMAF
jgi:hypothetical protein